MSTENVAQLALRERQSRDRGWYEEMAACYADDSVVDMSWFNGPGKEFVRRSRHMSESPNGWSGHSAHRLSPPTVHLNGSRALAELPLGIEFRITAGGVEADLVSYCRNQYRARRDEDGVWRLVRLTSIYERDTSPPRSPAPDSTSIPPSSHPFGPPTAAWPGTSTAWASRSGRTCSVTTGPSPSKPSTTASTPGCTTPPPSRPPEPGQRERNTPS
jgi:hypothetical protein